jgi:hypothetical protein
MNAPEYEEQKPVDTRVEFITDLSNDQIELHKYLKRFCKSTGREPTHKEILSDMDYIYNYFDELHDHPERDFVNMSCRRKLSDDLEALAFSTTTHTVFTGHGYAQDENESKIREKKLQIKGKESFKKAAICKRKRELNKQYYYDFNTDRKKNWSSYVKEQLDIVTKAFDNDIETLNKEIDELQKEVS